MMLNCPTSVTLNLQRVRIMTGTAMLLPLVFPSLSSLHLRECEQDTFLLLIGLRACQHLRSLTLDSPVHLDPAGLCAAGEATPAAAGAEAKVAEARAAVAALEQEQGGGVRMAAATGALLGALTQLTTLHLSLEQLPAALISMASSAGSVGLKSVYLGWAKMRPQDDNTQGWACLSLALRACTNLENLAFPTWNQALLPALECCDALQGLRCLHMHHQWLDQGALDTILRGMPGGMGMEGVGVSGTCSSRSSGTHLLSACHCLFLGLGVAPLAQAQDAAVPPDSHSSHTQLHTYVMYGLPGQGTPIPLRSLPITQALRS